MSESQAVVKGLTNSLINVFQSVNEESIIMGGQSQGPAMAFIYTYEEMPESYSVEIYFQIKNRQDGIRLRYERGSVQRFRLRYVEDQALEFVESMGFMMDNLQIQNLPIQQKSDMLKTLPFIERKEVSREKSLSSSEVDISDLVFEETGKNDIRQKVSRLLSSF